MELPLARSGMEIVSRKECLRLLAGQHVGRLGFLVGDQPMVLPVNYGLDGDVVVFRTGEGSKLKAAFGTKVTFEIDGVDDDTRSGWSVVVQGVAEEMSAEVGWFAETIRRAAPSAWIPGPADHFVRVVPTHISGRRILSP